MILNKNRVGRATSSNAHLLLVEGKSKYGFGAGAITYSEQKKAERSFGRSVDTGGGSQATTWGKVMEKVIFADPAKIGLEYSLESLETVIHPDYNFWAGSPDIVAPKKVGEIKSFYLENYYKLSKLLLTKDLDGLKKNYKDVYWQLVSNCAIMNKRYGEIIAWVPRYSELIEIRKMFSDFFADGWTEHIDLMESIVEGDVWPYRFIVDSPIEKLPWIPDDIEYPSVAKFEFEIPVEDTILLTKRMIDFEKLINE